MTGLTRQSYLDKVVASVAACPATKRERAKCVCSDLIEILTDEERIWVRKTLAARGIDNTPRNLHYNYQLQHWIYADDFPGTPKEMQMRGRGLPENVLDLTKRGGKWS